MRSGGKHIQALAEMQGLFAFRVRSTVVVRSAVNRMVEGSNPSCPANSNKVAIERPFSYLAPTIQQPISLIDNVPWHVLALFPITQTQRPL